MGTGEEQQAKRRQLKRGVGHRQPAVGNAVLLPPGPPLLCWPTGRGWPTGVLVLRTQKI